jgi:prepilin-type N-terminal cleavage/methylation domain-containing protein
MTFNWRDQKGLTLLEVVIALSLLTVIIMGLMFVVGSTSKAMTMSKDRDRATALASTFLELLGTTGYDDLIVFNNVNTSDANATFPEEPKFYSICDRWRNEIKSTLSSDAFGVVRVETNTPVAGRTRITVFVFWERGGSQHSVNMVEVR